MIGLIYLNSFRQNYYKWKLMQSRFVNLFIYSLLFAHLPSFLSYLEQQLRTLGVHQELYLTTVAI